MEFTWRAWSAVMVGDVVLGAGQAWSVERWADEPGSRDGDGARVVWVQLRGGVGGTDVRTLRIPNSSIHVEMSEGPGYGVEGASEAALTWASDLIAVHLGGTVVGADLPA